MRELAIYFKEDLKRLLILIPLATIILLSFCLLFLIEILIILLNNQSLTSAESYKVEYLPKECISINGNDLKDEIIAFDFKDEELDSYTNNIYGYSFQFPKGIDIKELLSESCNGIYCLRLNKNEDLTIVDSLNILAYYSDSIMDFDYDEGLEKSSYKEPIETVIDGETYYYIVSKDGLVNMLAYEYKYEGDILWVKTEHKVKKDKESYYISFIGGADILEEEAGLYEAIFKTFKF